MATVNMARGSDGHATRNGNTSVPYLVEREFDWADVVAEKGSAIVTADVIQAINVPAKTLVYAAGVEVIEADTTADTAVADLGDGADPDRYAVDFDLEGAVGAASAVVAANVPFFYNAADTIDLVLDITTTAPSNGKLRVWAVVQDAADRPAPGTAPRGG